MIQELLTEQRAKKFRDLSGSRLSITLPVSKEMLTLSFNSVENEAVELFQIREIHPDYFLLDFKPKNYRQMHIKGAVDPQIGSDEAGNPELRINILSGINILEKGAILLFSSRLPDAIDLSPSKLTINLRKMLEQMELADLAPFIHWRLVESQQDRLVFNFDLKV